VLPYYFKVGIIHPPNGLKSSKVGVWDFLSKGAHKRGYAPSYGQLELLPKYEVHKLTSPANPTILLYFYI
jgi:hypothetical protein